MSRKRGLEEVIIGMDLAIYAKAQYIVWKQPGEFGDVVLRMGAFHTAMTFIAVIGKRFGDGGLSDLLIEDSIVAASSMSGVLAGRQYNRAMRAHKIVMEATQRLRLKSFKEWLEENENDAYKESTEELYDDFCRNDRGKLAAFWDSYIALVCLLL